MQQPILNVVGVPVTPAERKLKRQLDQAVQLKRADLVGELSRQIMAAAPPAEEPAPSYWLRDPGQDHQPISGVWSWSTVLGCKLPWRHAVQPTSAAPRAHDEVHLAFGPRLSAPTSVHYLLDEHGEIRPV